jgi:hypothetical protein
VNSVDEALRISPPWFGFASHTCMQIPSWQSRYAIGRMHERAQFNPSAFPPQDTSGESGCHSEPRLHSNQCQTEREGRQRQQRQRGVAATGLIAAVPVE